MSGLHPTRSPLLLVLALGAALAALADVAWPERTAPAGPQQEGYVGMDQCAECHEELVGSFRASIHGQKGFELRSRRSCEACHGPGKAHVDAGGGLGSMVMPRTLPAGQRSGMCLTCHERGAPLEWTGSRHESRGLACGDCHSVHHAATPRAQLMKPETDLCFGCHAQKRSQFLRSSHHPVREGLMRCSDCHNPHAVQEGRLVDQAAVTESCYRCHAEKRGPFLWEHIPVREDCQTCHEPHGSNHMKMLKSKEPFLCQRCHSDTRHPGTLYDQTQLLSASNRLFGRSCTNCHATIHGSNHPSGRTFVR